MVTRPPKPAPAFGVWSPLGRRRLGFSAEKIAAVWRRRGVRVLLAGGLTPYNAAAAARAARPFALDVSSGVERVAGVKDAELLRAFFDAAARYPETFNPPSGRS